MNVGVLQPGFQDEKEKCTMKGEVKVRKGEGRERVSADTYGWLLYYCYYYYWYYY